MTESFGSRARAFLTRMLASGFFISYIPTAIIKKKCSGAGLLGTLLAAALLPLTPERPLYSAIFLIAFTIFAIWIADKAVFGEPRHDDPKIVIDEVIGYWISMAFIPRTFELMALSFVLFRILDSAKPFFIKKLDAIPGGAGVVLDDAASGVITNILVRIFMLAVPCVKI